MKKTNLVEFKRTILFPTYHYKIHVIVTNDLIASRKKRNNILGALENDPKGEFVDGMHSHAEGSFEAFIFLRTPGCQSTLVHEAYHGISRMFEYIGEDKAGEEVFAYTLGYLVEQMFSFITFKKRK